MGWHLESETHGCMANVLVYQSLVSYLSLTGAIAPLFWLVVDAFASINTPIRCAGGYGGATRRTFVFRVPPTALGVGVGGFIPMG